MQVAFDELAQVVGQAFKRIAIAKFVDEDGDERELLELEFIPNSDGPNKIVKLYIYVDDPYVFAEIRVRE